MQITPVVFTRLLLRTNNILNQFGADFKYIVSARFKISEYKVLEHRAAMIARYNIINLIDQFNTTDLYQVEYYNTIFDKFWNKDPQEEYHTYDDNSDMIIELLVGFQDQEPADRFINEFFVISAFFQQE